MARGRKRQRKGGSPPSPMVARAPGAPAGAGIAAVPTGVVSPADRRHWRRGWRDFDRRHYARALESWRSCQAPGTEAAQAEALFRLAEERRPAEAVAHLREAVRLAPGDALYRYHLALGLWREGTAEEAMRHAAAAAAMAESALTPRLRSHAALMCALAGVTPPRPADGQGPEHGDLVPAAATTDDSWRLPLVAAMAEAGGRLPAPRPAMPPWLAGLLGALRAVVSEEWATATRSAAAVLGATDVPPAALALAEWAKAEALASQGRWGALLATPTKGPVTERLRVLRRAAAAAILVRTLAAGDATSAAAMLPRLAEPPGLSPAARVQVAVALGQARAAQGDWAEAIRHWSGVTARGDLAQPLAVANERLGRLGAAVALWREVGVRLHQGTVPSALRGLSVGLVRGTVAAHTAELLIQLGDHRAGMLVVEEALTQAGTELPAPFCLKAARQYAQIYAEPCPQWEIMGELLERGLRGVPDDDAAWAALATLRRRTARPDEAVEADRHCVALTPDNQRFALHLVEDTGRSILSAWARMDLDAAERLTAGLCDPTGVPLPTAVQARARMVADLAGAVWDRVRHKSRSRPISSWDHVLQRGEPGVDVPLCAYVFRGMLSLLGGRGNAAERFFLRFRDADYWDDVLPEEGLALAAYCRWIGSIHCWTRQFRAAGGSPTKCERGCEAMWPWLTVAAMVGAASPQPEAVPPLLAGCPHLPRLYADWVREQASLRGGVEEFVRMLEETAADAPESEDTLGEIVRRMFESRPQGSGGGSRTGGPR